MIIVKKIQDPEIKETLSAKLSLDFPFPFHAFSISEDESMLGIAAFGYPGGMPTVLAIRALSEDPVYIELGLRAVLNFFDTTGAHNVDYLLNDEQNISLAKRLCFMIEGNRAHVNTTEFFSRKCEGSSKK